MSQPARPFETLLVANRGEIALRIIAAARKLGLRTVAVYSEAERGALHARAADAAVCIGGAAPAQSYLSIERILDACRRTGAGAIHPGYGFLSENASFARACDAAGLVFVGPPAEAIAAMGDKAAAKRRMQAAGIACIPGYAGEEQSDARLAREAERIGFPLLVKAAAGGGGRGMRRVERREQLAAALAAARAEAAQAFGSGALLLERLLEGARHVETQVMADAHGAVVHLGERDCSLQRRYQKVIEEAPSPAVTPPLRERMGAVAVAAARAIGYVGAGTVECLLEDSGEFWFMEMNTRLQVEHPVTELVTGLDLVELQLRVARGERLPLTQQEVRIAGHAIEARLYAEDSASGFVPQTGRVLHWDAPSVHGVRIDSGIERGSEVTPHYDPLLAKVVAHGSDRDVARRRLIGALRGSCVLGVATNREFLIACLSHARFAAGSATTAFVDEHLAALAARAPLESDFLRAALVCYAFGPRAAPAAAGVGRLRQEFDLECQGVRRCVALARDGEALYVIDENGAPLPARASARDGRAQLEIAGVRVEARFAFDDGRLWMQGGGAALTFTDRALEARASSGSGETLLRSPLAGRVAAVLAAPGDAVERGQSVIVIESMKMENHVAAGATGVVSEILVQVGVQVAPGARLARIAPHGVQAAA
jgi:geranyl-CoA carboxylase alpha subunit